MNECRQNLRLTMKVTVKQSNIWFSCSSIRIVFKTISFINVRFWPTLYCLKLQVKECLFISAKHQPVYLYLNAYCWLQTCHGVGQEVDCRDLDTEHEPYNSWDQQQHNWTLLLASSFTVIMMILSFSLLSCLYNQHAMRWTNNYFAF